MWSILEKVDSDDIFEKVSDDAKDILEEIYDDGDDIFEKVLDNVKDSTALHLIRWRSLQERAWVLIISALLGSWVLQCFIKNKQNYKSTIPWKS